MKPIEALNKINSIAFTFYTAGAFAAASNLKIFDFLEGEGLTPQELAEKIDIHPQGCQSLLSAMENLELLENNNGRYSNSPAGHYLNKDAEVPMSFAQKDYYFYRMWECLPDALREFSPRHLQAWGKTAQDLYKATYSNEQQLRDFFRLLDSYNIPIGQKTAEVLDFKPYQKILDVAGGTGSFAAEVVKTFDNLSGVVLDLEPVRMLSEEMIAKDNLAGRFEFISGDMFKADDYPEGVDVIFLSYILHNWDDENCKVILQNCFDALPSKGMLVVSEKVLNNDFSGDWWGVMMSLQMLIAFEPGAKERTINEYTVMLEEVGFKNLELLSLDAPRDLLIAFKP